MKIHYLATSNIPSKTANSLQIVKMCEAFSLLGKNINLIVPNLSCINKSIDNYYDLKSKIKIYKIGKKIKLMSGLNHFFLPLKIIKKSFELRPDLIITRNLLICFVLIILKKKHIFEIHDDLSSGGKILSSLFKYLRLLNSPVLSKVIFITKSLKKFIKKEYNYNCKNYLILPDATDIKNYKKNYNFKKKLKKIGYFGSVYSSRGLQLIIGLSRLDKNNKYYIYGGSKDEFLEIKKFNSKNLIIHPQISYKDVKRKISEMDILLMPYTNKATFSGNTGNIINFMSPMKMFDYLGAGRLIISSEIKVLKEILKNNYNAILIKNYLNIYSWKKQIDKVNFKNNKYIKIRKNALKTAKKYTWEKRASQMITKI